MIGNLEWCKFAKIYYMKHLYILLFVLISAFSQAQTIKHKATHQAFRTSDVFTEKFGKWSDWEKTDVIIIIDVKLGTLAIYESPKKIYLILGEIEQKEFTDKSTIVFDALDENNTKCIVELVHYNTNKNQLYIRWSNFHLVYEIIRL